MALTKELKAKAAAPGETGDIKNISVILVTAADWNTIGDEARKSGVDKFLSKPLFASSIVDVVNEILGVDKNQMEKVTPGIEGIFTGRRLLLAEDVEINREIVLTLLEPTGLQIDCAENGVKAVLMFSQAPEKYDMIFMDVQMPEMDGYEATQQIRALEREMHKTDRRIPIIAMTANVFREDIEKCLEAGMDNHIGKPLNLDEVIERLRTFLL